MQTAILTTQSKGQIMLPKVWREALGTNIFQAVRENKVIILTPISTPSAKSIESMTKKFIKKNKALLDSLAKK